MQVLRLFASAYISPVRGACQRPSATISMGIERIGLLPLFRRVVKLAGPAYSSPRFARVGLEVHGYAQVDLNHFAGSIHQVIAGAYKLHAVRNFAVSGQSEKSS